jgi:hypothetical protein
MDRILQSLLDELSALGGDVSRAGGDTMAFVRVHAAKLRALAGDPGFPAALDAARRACVARAVTNGIIAADAADDRAWDAAFGVALRVAAAVV